MEEKLEKEEKLNVESMEQLRIPKFKFYESGTSKNRIFVWLIKLFRLLFFGILGQGMPSIFIQENISLYFIFCSSLFLLSQCYRSAGVQAPTLETFNTKRDGVLSNLI